uniref:Uncharacterized protein At2g41050 n=1 Tax=Arabidopsis thaliana TaxID=3702 RepID=O80679_ARATH|nr:hypothetical protein [Arabidopsis thaliana]
MFLHSSFRDGLSLSLGIISVISWGVAEIPQIMTNYSEKSTEGLSITFLTTWMIGSARSLSSSHTPPAGSVLAQRMARGYSEPTLEEPLLPEDVTHPSTKSLLCVVSVFLFLGTFNLPNLLSESRTMALGEGDRVFVVRAARKLLQVTSSNVAEHSGGESSRIGMFLGWAMAAIYMGGRLPQICLNMRRGHVEILLQFFHFRCRKDKDTDKKKHETAEAV